MTAATIALFVAVAATGPGETSTSSVGDAPRFVTRTSSTARDAGSGGERRGASRLSGDDVRRDEGGRPPPRWVAPEEIPRSNDGGLLVTGGLGGAIALLAYRLVFFSFVTGSFTEGGTIATVLGIDTFVAPLFATLPFYGLMTGSDDWDYGFWGPYLGAGAVNALLIAAALGAGQSSEDAASAILFVDLFLVPIAAVIGGAMTREIGEGERPVWTPSARAPVRPPEDPEIGAPPMRAPFAVTFAF